MFVFGFPCGARDNPWPSIIAVERESLSVLFFFFPDRMQRLHRDEKREKKERGCFFGRKGEGRKE